MKTCTKCKRPLPLASFRKYSGRSRDGLRPICKECQRDYEAEYRKARVAEIKASKRKRAAKEKEYKRGYNARFRAKMLVMEAGRRARKRGIPFDLDGHLPELDARIQAGICEMTGVPLNLHTNGMGWDSPSLDRIVPEKGYVISNIRVVCFLMNAAMGKWGEARLAEVMTKWMERK